MNLGISDSRLVLRRQRRVRVAAGLITLGLLIQAQSFLAPGMSRFLGFGMLGVPIVLAGVGLAALALFGPTRMPSDREPAAHETTERAPEPSSSDSSGPT